MCCPKNTLNGLPLGGNTEGGRLHLHIEKCNQTQVINKVKSPYCCSPYKKTIQAEITSSEGNRISDLSLGCVRGVTQDRIQQLLSSPRRFPSQTARLTKVQQDVINCSDRTSVPVPIITTPCPPLPPPPGPPYICSVARIIKY
jgi:hypothetical protein